MKINIKELQVSMSLGNNGITLDVSNNDGTRRGALHIGRAKIIWCKGKTKKENGKSKTWDELIDHFNA